MKKILLVLSTAAPSANAVEVALAKASKTNAPLIGLFVVDVALTGSIFDRLEGTTSVGERPGQAVQEALMGEYQRQGEQQLEELVKQADAKGVRVEKMLRVGEFAEECIKVIREQEVAVTVITRTHKSQLSRFIFGSPIKKIQDNVTCEFEIIELD